MIEATSLHQRLLQELRDGDLLSDPRVEEAFCSVPRHLFLPGVPLETVYTDDAIPTRSRDGFPISSSSQPAVMATMLDQLDLRPGHRVLEIGAGTGYNAALMARIVGPTGHVVTMDIEEDIVDDACAHLSAAGFPEVQVVCSDGALGHPEGGPYDRIILAVGAWDVAPAWIEQLRPGGRLDLPLAVNGCVQKLVALERRDGHLVSVSVRDGSFMPLRGACAGPQVRVPLGPDSNLFLALGEPRPVAAGRVYALLTGPSADRTTDLRVTHGDLWGGVSMWLALRASTMCGLMARGEALRRNLIPSPFSTSPQFHATVGLLDDVGLCLLAPSAAGATAVNTEPFDLAVRSYGSGGPVGSLLDFLRTWDSAGRPSADGVRIRVYPKGIPVEDAGSAIIDKPQTTCVLDWPLV